MTSNPNELTKLEEMNLYDACNSLIGKTALFVAGSMLIPSAVEEFKRPDYLSAFLNGAGSLGSFGLLGYYTIKDKLFGKGG